MKTLKIKTDRAHGEVDLVFYPGTDSKEHLDTLHDVVLPSIDGARVKGGIEDAIVAIRKYDFDDVVSRLANYYRQAGYTVTIQ